MTRLASVQSMRALAALLVVLVHCEPALSLIGLDERVVGAAAVGVDLFFVISGFIMIYTTDRTAPAPVDFMIDRIARIVPLYWLLTGATFLIALSMPRLLGATQANGADLLRSLLFIPYVRGDGLVYPVLYVGWSLNYEILFYLIVAASLMLRRPAARLAVAAGAIVALVCAGLLLDPDRGAMRFFTRPLMLEFVFGMLLARVYDRLPSSRRAARLAAGTAAIGVVLLLLAPFAPSFVLPPAGLAATLLLTSVLVMERGGLAPDWRALLLIGDASYALYLTHSFVAQAVFKLSAALGLLTPALAPALVGLTYLAACAVAVLVFQAVEKPMTRGTRTLLGRWRRTMRAGAPRAGLRERPVYPD